MRRRLDRFLGKGGISDGGAPDQRSAPQDAYPCGDRPSNPR